VLKKQTVVVSSARIWSSAQSQVELVTGQAVSRCAGPPNYTLLVFGKNLLSLLTLPRAAATPSGVAVPGTMGPASIISRVSSGIIVIHNGPAKPPQVWLIENGSQQQTYVK
jgi:hypothetical protein